MRIKALCIAALCAASPLSAAADEVRAFETCVAVIKYDLSQTAGQVVEVSNLPPLDAKYADIPGQFKLEEFFRHEELQISMTASQEQVSAAFVEAMACNADGTHCQVLTAMHNACQGLLAQVQEIKMEAGQQVLASN